MPTGKVHQDKVRVNEGTIEIIIYINPNLQMNEAELTRLVNEYYVYGILDAASYIADPETGSDPTTKALAQETFATMANSNQFLTLVSAKDIDINQGLITPT